MASDPPPPPAPASGENLFACRRVRIGGVDSDILIKVFFGGNALVAIIILLLITVFLFREGSGFFGQYRHDLSLYRRSGLEAVGHLRKIEDDYSRLGRSLSDIRARAARQLQVEGRSLGEINRILAELDDFITVFEENLYEYQDTVSEAQTLGTALRRAWQLASDQALLTPASGPSPAGQTLESELSPMREALGRSRLALEQLGKRLEEVRGRPLLGPDQATAARLVEWRQQAGEFLAGVPEVEARVDSWNPTGPVPLARAVTAFLAGRDWITNSFLQDWYGILPLLAGSLLVGLIALVLAVPLGVAAALYVNQIASPWEQRLIKPSIEFIAAIPSVVIGFFGVVVWGETVRRWSGWEGLSWVPFFPLPERLNAFTAGCLLALMAIPTIFTLAEDALNNVPRSYREASFALGATRLQTIWRITIPTALSGIISAILLGFGRVIGETMVVLLCAGNRISIPDFTAGPGVFFQPVHTMTGIIAQEMGEVVQGGLHYRALFMVGLVLFFISLFINYLAQKIVHRFRLSPG